MKLGIISDIHCNLQGLDRALALLDDCDEILCAGDILYQYRFSNDVLARLQHRAVQAIVGNHDKVILFSPGHPLRSSPSVDPAHLEYLARLPNNLVLEFGGMRLAMFHGSPWDDAWGTETHYIYPQDRQQLKRLSEVEADVIVLGHTHVPFVHEAGGQIVLNPGSCAEARDGTGILSCAMLDAGTGNVEFRRFTLDEK